MAKVVPAFSSDELHGNKNNKKFSTDWAYQPKAQKMVARQIVDGHKPEKSWL